ERLASEAEHRQVAGQIAFWKQQLTGAPALLELPTDRPRPSGQRYRGARHFLDLPEGLPDNLRRLGQEEGSTPFMTLLAAFKALLLHYTGQDDLVVGTPVANRARQETEGLIGFFVNSLALRTSLAGDPTVRDLLRRVRETTLEAYSHEELPFERV